MKNRIESGLKIIIGALITSAIACVTWYGMYEIIFLDSFNLVSYLSEIGLIKYLVLILVYCSALVMPIIIIIVHIIEILLCEKRRYLAPYQNKTMLLISNILFVAMGYCAMDIYCRKLDFGEGLGFVIEILFTLAVAVAWEFILIVLLVCERKSSHDDSTKEQNQSEKQ